MMLHSKVEVVAIGGSVGKTTTKDLTSSVLETNFKVVKSRANFDPIFNLPQTALTIRDHQKFVAEMGIDAPGQMDKYLTLVKPVVAVMTELSLEHSDSEHLQSYEIAVEEEWKLIEALPQHGLAILNGDNSDIAHKAQELKVQKLLYGFESSNQVQITDSKQEIKSGKPQLTINLSGHIEGEFSAPLIGRHNALCMTAAICIGRHFGLTDEQIQAGLNRVKPPEHRLELKPTPWGVVIDDTYNSSPKAAIAAIDVLAELGGEQSLLVLSDMLELGQFAAQAHQEVGQYAATRGIKNILVYGDFTDEIQRGYANGGGDGEVLVAQDREELIEMIRDQRPTVALLKASRGKQLNEVVDALVAGKH